MTPQALFLNCFIFFLGACFGSFLNVCIYRLPRELSLIFPGSHCPRCSEPIRWYDNIPFISFCLLGGRCRHCRGRISFRYFLVELLSALTLLGLFYRFHESVLWVVYALLFYLLIIVSFIDLEFQIIPDEISISGTVVGILLSGIFPYMHHQTTSLAGFLSSITGTVTGGLMIYLIGVFGTMVFKKESMGGGDVKLLAMIGAFLGFKYAILTFFIAPFFGSVIGIIAKLKYKQDIIPYGPFLSLGAVISLLWGEQILFRLFHP
ncbi:MAG: prepilin peptidase [Candidatus Omnitrophica bacterium]|nr:prepilin peptidase [Candidatus Omnitrophota bacterium]